MVKPKIDSLTADGKLQSEINNTISHKSVLDGPMKEKLHNTLKEIEVDSQQNSTNKDKKDAKKSFVRTYKKKAETQKKQYDPAIHEPENIDVEVIDDRELLDIRKPQSLIIDTDEYKESEVIDDDSLIPFDEKTLEYEEEDDDFELDQEIEINEPGLVTVDALQRYLAELRRYPLLSREDEKNVAINAFENNDMNARNNLVTANLRLVVKIAMEYRRTYSQILDLIQEGNAGLVQAVNRFNPYRGVKLSTYSAWWIRAYILKFLMDNKSLVRMGTTDAQRKLFFRLRGEAEKMYALTQKFDANLLAEKIGVEPQDVIDMQQRLTKNDLSLDTPVGEDNDTRQMDLLPSTFEGANDTYERKQLVTLLRQQLEFVKKDLNERDAYIFHNRIMSDDPITLQEVGEKYGITRERARQLEARVIKKIKDKLLESGILK